MSDYILVSKQKGVTTLTLNRPDKRNAMSGPVVKEILQTLQALAHDEETRVLMVRGNGEHFCAGADIDWMQNIAAGSLEANGDDAQLLADMLYQLYFFPKPTIVLAHGASMGGGLGLLAACDIAIGATNAFFGFSEVKLGVTPSTISPYIIAAIGERAARYYFLTGTRFSADDAMRIGLLHRVVAPEALLQDGMLVAEVLLSNSPKALTAAKQLIRYVSKEKITEELGQKTAEHLANMRASSQAQEGLRAFLEKRSPAWVTEKS